MTWRSVGLGLVGSAVLCGLTPYNNFVLNNTKTVGSFLPLGLLLLAAAFLALVNAPLWKLAPRHALSRGELGVTLAMVLLACTTASSGLMRYLPGHLVGSHHLAGADGGIASFLRDGGSLPDWLLPDFEHNDPAARAGEAVVTNYLGRTPGDPVALAAVPWAAWLRPALTWGVGLGLLFTAVVCLMAIVRWQWQENERLAFPLAEVYLSLTEEPRPGRAFAETFRSRSFLFAAGAVFAVHAFTGLANYWPQQPRIPLGYDFNALFAEPPLAFGTYGLKSNRVMFTIIGLAYFMPLRVSGSLWAFFLLFNLAAMLVGGAGGELTQPMQQDQTLGAMLAYGLGFAWVGRFHWTLVARRMLGRGTAADPQDPYLPYGPAGWALLACVGGMTMWLWLAGCSVAFAVLIPLVLLAFIVILGRVVAETGLIYVSLHAPLVRPAAILANDLSAFSGTARDWSMHGLFNSVLGHDWRESSGVLASTGLVVADRAARRRRRAWLLVPAMLAALAVGYVASGAGMLVGEYGHAASLDVAAESPVNGYGTLGATRGTWLGPAIALDRGLPGEAHSRPGHVALGAALCGVVTYARLTFAAFPLHPVGVVLMYSFALQNIWFSILLGWAAKALLLRLGGARLYTAARPALLGLILGESAAAALWLVVSLVRAALGLDYTAINLLLP